LSDPFDAHGELLDELRSVLDQVNPTPPRVTQFAKAALGWRRLDADLAELLADSALETDSAAPTRSTASSERWLTFGAPDLSIDVEVEGDGDARTLIGQLDPPPTSATIQVQAADGTLAVTTEADALGRFRLALKAGSRVRLRVLRHDPPGPPVETSWLSL
jgi:hypothetical protein